MTKSIRIATRNSPLAMWQAEFVQQKLIENHPDLDVSIISMTTKGDQLLDSPLSKIGGKGLFVKELEHAMLKGEADIAVHSMKDVGVDFPEGLKLGPVLKRHSPFDAFVSNYYQKLDDMPKGSIVGTCSLRRVCQLKKHYPHLSFKDLRGNVNTRLKKLDDGEYDAIILAQAGLERLGLNERIASSISEAICLPAIAQGSLGIELRSDDPDVESRLACLIDEDNTYRSVAERAVNERLQGSCQTPIAAYATLEGDKLYLDALIGSPDGNVMLTAKHYGLKKDAKAIGLKVANDLIDQGAFDILNNLTN